MRLASLFLWPRHPAEPRQLINRLSTRRCFRQPGGLPRAGNALLGYGPCVAWWPWKAILLAMFVHGFWSESFSSEWAPVELGPLADGAVDLAGVQDAAVWNCPWHWATCFSDDCSVHARDKLTRGVYPARKFRLSPGTRGLRSLLTFLEWRGGLDALPTGGDVFQDWVVSERVWYNSTGQRRTEQLKVRWIAHPDVHERQISCWQQLGVFGEDVAVRLVWKGICIPWVPGQTGAIFRFNGEDLVVVYARDM